MVLLIISAATLSEAHFKCVGLGRLLFEGLSQNMKSRIDAT